MKTKTKFRNLSSKISKDKCKDLKRLKSRTTGSKQIKWEGPLERKEIWRARMLRTSHSTRQWRSMTARRLIRKMINLWLGHRSHSNSNNMSPTNKTSNRWPWLRSRKATKTMMMTRKRLCQGLITRLSMLTFKWVRMLKTFSSISRDINLRK